LNFHKRESIFSPLSNSLTPLPFPTQGKERWVVLLILETHHCIRYWGYILTTRGPSPLVLIPECICIVPYSRKFILFFLMKGTDNLKWKQEETQDAEVHIIIRAADLFLGFWFFFPPYVCFALRLTSHMLLRWLQITPGLCSLHSNYPVEDLDFPLTKSA
jgi:hypothetical protein